MREVEPGKTSRATRQDECTKALPNTRFTIHASGTGQPATHARASQAMMGNRAILVIFLPVLLLAALVTNLPGK